MKDNKKVMVNDRLLNFLSFLLGFLCCGNIFHFNVGGFYLQFTHCVILFTFVVLIVTNKNKILNSLLKMNRLLLLFYFIALLSIIPAYIIFYNVSTDYIAEAIYLTFIIFIQYITIFTISDHREKILKGIASGFAVNVVISFIQYILYNIGIYDFTFYSIFPSPVLQVSDPVIGKCLSTDPCNRFVLEYFRPQGLFLETSYFVTFSAATSLIFFTVIKNKTFKIAIGLLMSFLLIIAGSANLIVFLAVYVLYFLIKIRNGQVKLRRSSLFIGIILCFLAPIGTYYYGEMAVKEGSLSNSVSVGIEKTLDDDPGNQDRGNSMTKGLSIIAKYPFGVGLGNGKNLLEKEFPEMRVKSVYNYLIHICLEVGIIGLIVYMAFIFSIIHVLYKKGRKSDYAVVMLVCFIGAFLSQISNGNNLTFCYIIVIFALADAESAKLKMEIKRRKMMR